MKRIAAVLVFALAYIGCLAVRMLVEFKLNDQVFELNAKGITMVGSMVQTSIGLFLIFCIAVYTRNAGGK